MANHNELASVSFNDGRHRLCLETVGPDEDGRPVYTLVWRGTRRSPNGHIPRPARFSMSLLGHVLGRALAAGCIPPEEACDFLAEVVGHIDFSTPS